MFISKERLIRSFPIIIFVVVPIFIGILVEIKNYKREENISQNKATTKGIIIKVSYGRSPEITWRYWVKGVCYEMDALDTRQFNFVKFCEDKSCLGDSVLVEYNRIDPSESRIVFHEMKSYR